MKVDEGGMADVLAVRVGRRATREVHADDIREHERRRRLRELLEPGASCHFLRREDLAELLPAKHGHEIR